MVELDSPRLDAVFHALGDATRRKMLRELSHGERTVGQLARPFAMSLAAASIYRDVASLQEEVALERQVG